MPLLIWAVPLLIWSGRLTSDYNAISVQLKLQLPTGTELGNKFFRQFYIGHGHQALMIHGGSFPLGVIGITNFQEGREVR